MRPPAGFANSDADPETLVIRQEWSDWGERHGRQSREGSGRAERERARYNDANETAFSFQPEPIQWYPNDNGQNGANDDY